MKNLFAVILLVALVVGVILLGPLVLQSLWGWFIVPFGVPAIGYYHAWGLMTVKELLFQAIDSYSEKKDQSFDEKMDVAISRVFGRLATCGILLLLGYFLHSGMTL